jgi:hypothetical protein
MIFIGKSVVIKGELSCCEDLYIEGQVEGTIDPKGNRLTIGPNGRVKANVTACAVVVQGKLEGNIQASDRVDLRQSAIVRRRTRHPHPYSDPERQIFTRFSGEISTVVAARRRCANLVSATADELFCWLHRIARQQGRPAATSIPSQHSMFAFRVSSSGMRFASQTNTQMRSGFNQALL